MSVLIILCLMLITCVTSEMQVHRVFVSRKSRSDPAPIKTGYMYKKVNNNPGTLSMFGSDGTTEPVLENYTELKKFLSPIQYHPIDFTKQNFVPQESVLSKRDLDYAMLKAESKYNSKFLPSKIRTDMMYERLKSAMHYQPQDNEMISRYDANDEYPTDDEDIRTGFRGVYDNWPSYYQNPYEYEYIKMNSEMEKAKDKRYAVDSARVIPIHEDLSHDIPDSFNPVLTTNYYKEQTTDNPMMGHDPFFSFILNDYFDKNHDDELSFKGIPWGNQFDMNDHSMRNRRLENGYSPVDHETTSSQLHHGHNELKADTVTEKGYINKHDFSKHEKGDKEKESDETKYEQNEHKYTGFKDFVDSFANKFGSEDNKKDANYILSRNQDKGENMKGFHRVYHKDEYQEDKEFYNNDNSSAKGEEKGSIKAHFGGSEGLLSSNAAASLGNQSSSFNKSGGSEKNRFENNNVGHDNMKGFEGHFNKYRDVAKQTALSNNADYSDQYRW